MEFFSCINFSVFCFLLNAGIYFDFQHLSQYLIAINIIIIIVLEKQIICVFDNIEIYHFLVVCAHML